MKQALLFVAALVLATCAQAETERDFQERFCAGWELEHRLPNGNRVDCLNGLHAIEVDFTHKWAEAIGQALHYSGETGRLPGVILICKASRQTCRRHELAYVMTLAKWRLPIDTWICDKTAALLGECRLVGPHEACK